MMVTNDGKQSISRDEGEYDLSKSSVFLIDELKIPNENYLTCFDIHKSFKQRILKYLNDKGINSDFIYPDPQKMISNSLKSTLE